MYKRILVPIDGSETAERGLREASALAQEQKATLHLLHVASDFPVMVEMANTVNVEELREGLHRYGHDLLARAKADAEAKGLTVETELREVKRGRVSGVILDEAKAAGCDLIVIGTHGRRGFNRALMGSDAELVVRESPVPVLVVRDPGAH